MRYNTNVYCAIFLPSMGLPGRAQKLYTMPMRIPEIKRKAARRRLGHGMRVLPLCTRSYLDA